MSISKIIHNKFIYNDRMSQLHKHISDIITKHNCSNILDIGAGDGKIDKMIQDTTNATIEGIDVLVRDILYIPVTEYDGEHINMLDNSINTTMMIDVLHHTENPLVVFNEAVRVSSKYIIIKDHLKHGFLSYLKLRLMDYVGNKHYSVNLPYNYLSESSWKTMFENANLDIVEYKTDLNLYKGLCHLLFDSNLHFIVLLKKEVN